MEKKLVGIPSIVFAIAIIFLFAGLTFLPVNWFKGGLIQEIARESQVAMVCLIVILLDILIAKRFKLWSEGGFVAKHVTSAWMLLIPFVFPGVLYFGHIADGCFMQSSHWPYLAGFLILRGIMEEVMFRGVIQGYLVKNYPKASIYKIVLFSSVAFALTHLIAIRAHHVLGVVPQVIYAFFGGLIFGALQVRVKNVWLVGVVHGLVNIMSTSCEVEQSGNISSWGEYFANLAGLALIFSPAVLVFWLLVKSSPEQAARAKNR
jgi:membrane protease YdiL (CAAX protease family)